eukprot:1714153-Rhodomonas_salina.1
MGRYWERLPGMTKPDMFDPKERDDTQTLMRGVWKYILHRLQSKWEWDIGEVTNVALARGIREAIVSGRTTIEQLKHQHQHTWWLDPKSNREGRLALMKELEFCYPLVKKQYLVQLEIRESMPYPIRVPPLPPMINPRAIGQRRQPPEVLKQNRLQQRRAAQGTRGPGRSLMFMCRSITSYDAHSGTYELNMNTNADRARKWGRKDAADLAKATKTAPPTRYN